MDNNNQSSRQLAEFLWIEINRAILKSQDVRNSIRRLDTLNQLQFISKYDLVLDMAKLIELAQNEEADPSGIRPQEGIEDRAEIHFYPEDLLLPKDKINLSQGEVSEHLKSNTLKKVSKTPKRRKLRIDGRILSRNEIRYQEYLEEIFDEDAWLKQAGILWKD